MSDLFNGAIAPRCSDDRFHLELIDEDYPCGDHYYGYAYHREVPSKDHQQAHPKTVAIKDGPGRYSFANGSYYEGEWRQGFMSGRGTFYEGDTGDCFDGTWTRGRRIEGTYRFSNGDVYIGAFDSEKGAVKVGPAIVMEDRQLFTAVYENDVATSKRPLSFVNKGSWQQLLQIANMHGDSESHPHTSPGGSPQVGDRRTSVVSTPPPVLPSADDFAPLPTSEASLFTRSAPSSPPFSPSDAVSPSQCREAEADAKHFVNSGGLSPDRLDPLEALEAAKVVLRMKRQRAEQKLRQQKPAAHISPSPADMSGVPHSMQPIRRSIPENYRPSRPRSLSTTTSIAATQRRDSVRGRRRSSSPNRSGGASSPVRQKVTRERCSGALDNQSFGALQRGQVVDFLAGPSTKELDIIYRFYR